jgi:dGTPase
MLASYACLPEASKGRIHPEQLTPYRNEFERDRDRLIHSNSFRRLQYKTQVFVNHEGDHYRNRLTHSLEVATIARSVSSELKLSEHLAETVALAHDLGHTPFGHAGEDALNACMESYGGFSHNAHSFKLLTVIEKRYAAYNGLNLIWEVLEGVIKHNGPILHKDSSYSYIFDYDQQYSLDLQNYSSAEAQVASLCDDIAYICHDLEDSVRAGIINYYDLQELPRIDAYVQEIKKQYNTSDNNVLIYEVARKLMHQLIKSLLAQTRENIKSYNIQKPEDIRHLGKDLVEFTPEIAGEIKAIKSFMMDRAYRHHKISYVMKQCKKIVHDLFHLYKNNIDLLPHEWRKMIDDKTGDAKMSIIADYIAGMTDRFAIKQHQAFFNINLMMTGL